MTKKQIEELKNIFDSIVCLAVEGPEFHNKMELVGFIAKEAGKGYDLCKRYMADAEHGMKKGWSGHPEGCDSETETFFSC